MSGRRMVVSLRGAACACVMRHAWVTWCQDVVRVSLTSCVGRAPAESARVPLVFALRLRRPATALELRRQSDRARQRPGARPSHAERRARPLCMQRLCASLSVRSSPAQLAPLTSCLTVAPTGCGWGLVPADMCGSTVLARVCQGVICR